MHRVVEVEARAGYRLFVRFADGVEGEVDLSGRMFGPMFAPLRESDFFRRLAIDEFGVVCWPNGADLAPDALHAPLRAAAAAGRTVPDESRA